MTKKYIFYSTIITAVFLLVIFFYRLLSTPYYLPKPKGYIKINLPDHQYVQLKNYWSHFPYSFAYSKQAEVNQKIENIHKEPFWMNIVYPAYNAIIQLTYKPVPSISTLQAYIQDAHQLIAKHYIKADGMIPQKIYTIHGNEAFIAEISGEVATPMQFYITDGKNHFLRGVLYFDNATQNDFLAPIIQYIKKDMLHLIHTTQWI